MILHATIRKSPISRGFWRRVLERFLVLPRGSGGSRPIHTPSGCNRGDNCVSYVALVWEAVKLVVANGAGISAISRFAIALELELEPGKLDVPRWRLTRTIAVKTARDVSLTPRAQRFRALLRERFAARSA
jgi:DNA-binding transcriptional LysR family regulator